MLVYFLIFCAGTLGALRVRSVRSSKAALWIVGVSLAVFAGTRFEVGCDYTGYEFRFDFYYLNSTWTSLLTEAESGFHLLNFGLIQLGSSYQILILVVSIIYLLCLMRFAWLHDRPVDVLVLLIPIMVIQLGMSGMRQALAVGFLMLAMTAFVDRRPWRTAAWVVFGSFFHTSVLMFLPLAMLARKEISLVRMLLALAVLGPLAALFMGDRMALYEARYIDQEFGENSSAGAWFRYAIAVVPFIVFEWKRTLVARAYPALFPLLRIFSLITFALPIVGLISSVALHRLGFYVLPVSILAMVCIAKVAFAPSSLNFARSLPFLAYGLYMLVWFNQSRHAASCYIPYQSWLF